MKEELENKFSKWYSTIGVRTYSMHHGSAKGHEDYMRHGWMHGYLEAMSDAKKFIESDNATKTDNN